MAPKQLKRRSRQNPILEQCKLDQIDVSPKKLKRPTKKAKLHQKGNTNDGNINAPAETPTAASTIPSCCSCFGQQRVSHLNRFANSFPYGVQSLYMSVLFTSRMYYDLIHVSFVYMSVLAGQGIRDHMKCYLARAALTCRPSSRT